MLVSRGVKTAKAEGVACRLDDGRWNGRKIVPAWWLNRSTMPDTRGLGPFGGLTDRGYAWLWWFGRGAGFETYAAIRVRGAMLDGVRKMAELPRRAHARLKHESEASPTAAPTPMDKAFARIRASVSGESPVQGHFGRESPESALLKSESIGRLLAALSELPERELFDLAPLHDPARAARLEPARQPLAEPEHEGAAREGAAVPVTRLAVADRLDHGLGVDTGVVGVERHQDIGDRSPRSVYFRQAGHGVPMRMALMANQLGAIELGVEPAPTAKAGLSRRRRRITPWWAT